MATITEDYVSFETAKLLKEKGFDAKCDNCYAYFADDDISFLNLKYPKSAQLLIENRYPCITLQMAMKWLREVHGLHISLEPCYDYDSMRVVFLAFVQNVADVHEFMDGRKNVASYPNAEKSCELAIKYCLDNLI